MLKYYYNIIAIIEALINLLSIATNNIIKLNQYNNYPDCHGKTLHILGNGPSLGSDIDQIFKRRNDAAVMVVNSFATCDLYKQIKPEFYVIVDPSFFEVTNQQRIKELQIKTSNALNTETHWPLKLFVPFNAKRSDFLKNIKLSNSNIQVVFFKNIPVIGGSDSLNNMLFQFKLANPLFQNVLIAAIFFGVKMKHSRIIIWGSDHSWHEDYILGKDNHIYTPDKHFYNSGETTTSFMHCKSDGTPLKVHEEFFILSRAFRIYHSLKLFADSNNCRIINLSSKTWIDAFDRNE